MENLRWILIFAGVAILLLLYVSGRQKKTITRQRDGLGKVKPSGSRITSHGVDDGLPDPLMVDDFADIDALNANETVVEYDDLAPAEFTEDPLERPGGPELRERRPSTAAASLGSTISSKIEAFGEKLSPNRKARVAASEPSQPTKPQSAYASKIVTLHVVAPENQLLNGQLLLELFEQRGYLFGDMDIFHSMHDGKTVFSVAKLVVPGTFDIHDVDSFQTPGISLILQLPGPVPADVAFEVLLSEASEMADALGGFVLDADRSTLSKQTVQHMREGIYEYMHRQKYFSTVPS